VRDRNWPEAGDPGPEMKDGLRQQPSSSAIAEVEQGDRRDPVTVIVDGFEAHGRLSAQLAMDGRPPIEAPVRIELLVELPVPASWSRRKTADAITGHIRPTSRPDVDNYLKAILDAISTIVVADDAQVVEVYAKKKFSVAPKMIATIFPLDATPSNRRASRCPP
jgi:Holliday junction resolvase RusA-like endonuclease